MNIAFIIYNGMTALDFGGVYDSLTRLKTMDFIPDLNWSICARERIIKDHTGLCFNANVINQPLSNRDMIIVPGGPGSRELVNDDGFISWIRTAADCEYKVSVCTGSLILGAAGFLKNKKATSHPAAYDKLINYCSEVIDKKIVDNGDVITAGAVTSSIDLGLYLCQKLVGSEVCEQIRKRIGYHEIEWGNIVWKSR